MTRSTAPSAVPPRLARRDPGRRQRILDVAQRHFTERGFAGTRLDDVAAEAGCAKGTLYLEFDDKETLLREVVERAFARVLDEFTTTVLPQPSPLRRLCETLRFAFRQHRAEPLFARLLRDDPELRVLRGEGDDAWKRAAEQRAAMLREWVDEGVRLGEIRADVDPDVVPGLLGILRFAPQHLDLVMAGQPLSMSGDRLLDGLVDLFENGLAARPTGASATGRPAATGGRSARQMGRIRGTSRRESA